MEKKNESLWLKYDNVKQEAVETFATDYRRFISDCKTERECVRQFIKKAKTHGFSDFRQTVSGGQKPRPGDKFYIDNGEKNALFFIVGSQPITDGLNIIAGHIDSPRIDLKPNPLFESDGLAMFDTHYYGGIKKYQWMATPLALHGVVVKRDGSKLDIVIGEDDNDPIFAVSDLLPHLAKDQMKKTVTEAFPGEALDLCVGTIPLANEKEEAVKKNIAKILGAKYNITEQDFQAAELYLTPAGKARELGLDRSLIAAYGHDDRVCSYTAVEALFEMEKPQRTCFAVVTDKEEIGSVGTHGMYSHFFENNIAYLLELLGESGNLKWRLTLENSQALSADVSVAYDPNFPSEVEKKNCARFGYGISFSKYIGARGKGGSNDATPEYVAKVTGMLDKEAISYQFCELGKVDQGGGGTIADCFARYNMDVLDCGVPIQSMHSLWEVASKADVYETKEAFRLFFASGLHKQTKRSRQQ